MSLKVNRKRGLPVIDGWCLQFPKDYFCRTYHDSMGVGMLTTGHCKRCASRLHMPLICELIDKRSLSARFSGATSAARCRGFFKVKKPAQQARDKMRQFYDCGKNVLHFLIYKLNPLQLGWCIQCNARNHGGQKQTVTSLVTIP